jgi:glycosyltransferase involved in cell wall biosynthesis
LKSSDLYISTSSFEGFNIPIAEAFLADIPAVAYDLSVYREIYHDAVIYVPPFDLELFAEKAEELLSNQALSKRHAQEGKKLVLREYSPQVVLKKIEKALNATIRSHN